MDIDKLKDAPDLLQALLMTGAALAQPIEHPDGGKVVPHFDGSGKVVLEHFKSKQPDQIEAAPVFQTAESFCDYVKHYKDNAGESRIFADMESWQFIAILDWPAPGEPRLKTHKASFKPQFDESWQRWQALNGKTLEQAEFARYLEEYIGEVVAPSQADLLEVANDLQINSNVEAAKSIRLQTGATQIQYVEKTDARTKGNVTIPQKISIKCPMFFGEEPIVFNAFLRFRAKPGSAIVFMLEIEHLQRIMNEAFLALVARIGQASAVAPLLGRPA
jgi:uncharacterized protein YfdQ (DUF2303 family)